MNTRYSLLLLAAALAAPAIASAQSDPNYQTQQQPAPVERSAPDYSNQGNGPANYGRPQRQQRQQQAPNILTIHPVEGISVRSNVAVETVSATAGKVELRLPRGIANVTVHHPAKDTLTQVDLPGGQVNLLKDGLYTFNAATNTVRTLKGEAETTVAGNPKPVKIKENHSIALGTDHKTHDFYPLEARNDLLANPAASDRGYGYAGDYGVYPAPYPYYAYGYPYYGYPYFGYPGIGFGFGYYGGFGGFRGGYGRGFRR